MWCSKQKYTIRTSTIGQEFIVTKAAPEMIQPLQYKLHKMGIPINGPTNMFCDNEAVVRNSVMSETILKSEHVAICYHCVHEACALGMIQIAKEEGATNLADIYSERVYLAHD